MTKQLIQGMEALQRMQEGALKLANAVGATLGPQGRNVVIERPYSTPLVTNDGVTIAKEIELQDPYENLGASMLKEASIRANSIAGDGTTTACVLAKSMLKLGMKYLASGANPIAMRKGMEKTLQLALEKLSQNAQPICTNKQIEEIASISAGDQDIGKLIASAVEKVGKDGLILAEESESTQTWLKMQKGMSFDRGYISSYMVTHESGTECVMQQPYILVTSQHISKVQDIVPVMELVATTNKPLVVIAEDIDGEALAALVVNKMRGILPSVAVKAPAFGEKRKQFLQDICMYTGATLISQELGNSLHQITLENLGSAQTVRVTQTETVLIEGAGEKTQIEQHVQTLKEKQKQETDAFMKQNLQERIAKLTGGIAIMKVGGGSELEMQEKKLRMDDAISSTKAALQEGVVCGGGIALFRLQPTLNEFVQTLQDDEKIGGVIIADSVCAPLIQIAENSGVNGEVVAEQIKQNSNKNYGYNAYTNSYVDLMENGVIDPVMVTKSALQASVSVASTMLTTQVLITNLPDVQNKK